MSRQPAQSFTSPFDALGREAGVEGVRWLLRSHQSRARLSREVQGMLAKGTVVVRTGIRDAVVKPRRHLRASFTVWVRDSRGATVGACPIAVTWQLGRGGVPVVLEDRTSGALPANPNSSPPVFDQFAVQVRDWAMRVWAWPYDPAFPQVPLLVAAGSLGRPGYAARPVRYVPGVAHVLRFDPAGPSERGDRVTTATLFAKAYPDPDLAEAHLAAIRAAAAAVARAGTAVRVSAPTGAVLEGGALIYAGVPGSKLSEYLRRGDPGAAPVLQSLGAGLRALHDAGLHEQLPALGIDSEIRRTQHAAQHWARFAPGAAATAAGILQRCAAAAPPPAAELPVLVHGDLKAEHVLVSRARQITLIDLDSCAVGEPAVDVGRVLGEIRWALHRRGASGHAAVASLQEQFLRGYGAPGSVPPERLLRGRCFELIVFIRCAARLLHLWDPLWVQATEGAVAEAAEAAGAVL